MAEFAALPIFTDAMIADTSHLSDKEFGRYMRLLMVCWRSPQCRIPNDSAWIAKRLRLDSLQYDAEIQPLIEEFFSAECSGNANAYAHTCKWITQKRLLKEFVHVRNKVEKNRAAAKSRWDKEKTTCERISKRNAPTPTPTPTSNKKESMEIPSFIDYDTWIDFVAHRGGKKFTQRMAKRIIKQLSEWQDNGHDVNKILNTSIMNGWKGVFEPDTQEGTKNGNKSDADAELARFMGKA